MTETPTYTRQRTLESTISIVLVDEQIVVTEGMRRLFEAEPGFRVVGSACDPYQATRLVEEHRPDVVLASLKGRALVRLASRLAYHPGTAAANDARLVVLTTANENSRIFRTPQPGIAAILFKQTSPQQLFENVRRVVAGGDRVGAGPWVANASGLDDAADPLSSVLTPRELQIVEAVGRGETNREIARQLAIRRDTVKHHLTRIFNKLGLFNRLQLAVYALNPDLSQHLEAAAFPATADYRTH